MYIQRNTSKGKNGKVYESKLLCHKFREDGKIKTDIIANLSKLPEDKILSISNLFKKGNNIVNSEDIVIKKSIDFGLTFLLIDIMEKLRIKETLEKTVPEIAPILMGIIIGKIITRGSKLGIYNWLMRNKEISAALGVETTKLKVDDLYSALGQCSTQQNKIEQKRFLYQKGKQKTIYLYDITSTYFEGVQNVLADFGYNRDRKKGKMQINIGLVTDSEGFPLKIEVFEGNVNDQTTVLEQIKSLKERFKVEDIIFVGDRGMKIRYNLEQLEEAERADIKYITGLTHAEIEQLLELKIIQLSLFSKELAEVDFEGFRYVLSINPDLQERELNYLYGTRSRVDEELDEVKAGWEKRHRKNLENIEKIKAGDKNKKLITCFSEKAIDRFKFRVESILCKHHMKKYYHIDVSNESFMVDFQAETFQQSRHLAGKYVVVSNIAQDFMSKEELKEQYKNLQNVEHAFRDFKSDNIQIRPVYHRNEAQTRGHVLLSLFSYVIIKELESKLYPFLKETNQTKKCHLSFEDMLEELKDIKLCKLNIGKNVQKIQITELTKMQSEIFKLFGMTKSDIDKKYCSNIS